MKKVVEKALKLLVSASILFPLLINAQAPVLGPEQTVNLSTGEMGFTLPLGLVRGMGGVSFPVNLYYHAGIRLDEDASPAGLGFGYEAGIITKKEIFVNDDNFGEAANYQQYVSTQDHAETAIQNITIASIVTMIVVLTLSFVPSPFAGFAGTFINAIASSALSFSPVNFNSGGNTVPVYNGDGKGFLQGGTADLPDVYYVNSPYVNGSFTWIGDRNTGHFVFNSSNGSNEKGNQTIEIVRHVDAALFTTFEFILTDGTRLFFDKYDAIPNTTYQWYHYSIYGMWDIQGCNYAKIKNMQSVPTAWHLTKILFNTYTGKGAPVNPSTGIIDPTDNNNGAWICFNYETINTANLVTPWQLKQTAHLNSANIRSALYFHMGGTNPGTINYLKTIVTPNDHAEYDYTYNRKDNLFFNMNNNTYAPFLMPLLDSIVIKNNSNQTIKRADFIKDYSLRPCTFSAFKFDPSYFIKDDIIEGTNLTPPFVVTPVDINANPHCCALTLKQVQIKNANAVKSYPITFSYIQYPGTFGYQTTWNVWNASTYGFTDNYTASASLVISPELGYGTCQWSSKNKYFIPEYKDYWGYYLGIHYGGNDNCFNRQGAREMALQPISRTGSYIFSWTYDETAPWASNWSMNKITFASGASLAWQYEANKYYWANGTDAFSTKYDPPPEGGIGFQLEYLNGPRYGSGIRVKKVTVDNGNSNINSLSYLYNRNGVIDKTNTDVTTGYTTVEPYDYLYDDNDHYWNYFGVDVPLSTSSTNCRKRNPASRGGLYTPSKVFYQQVTVAKNYNETTGAFPNGYIVYNFTHAGDPTLPGFHPNGGQFGQVDSSWERGLLQEAATYDKSGQLVQKKTTEYEFKSYSISPTVMTTGSYYCDGLWNNSIGWAKAKKVAVIQNNVKRVSENKYADDLLENNPDKVAAFVYDIKKTVCKKPGGGVIDYGSGSNFKDGFYSVETQLSGTDLAKPDVFFAVCRYMGIAEGGGGMSYETTLYLIKDIDFSTKNGSFERIGQVFYGPEVLTGMNICKFSGDNDLVLIYMNSITGNLEFQALRNVSYSTLTQNFLQNLVFYGTRGTTNLPSGTIQSDLVTSSAIGDIDGNGTLDLLFFSNSNHQVNRKLFAFLNGSVTYRPGGQSSVEFNSSCCATLANVPALQTTDDLGTYCRLASMNTTGSNNDLLFTIGHYEPNNELYHNTLYELPDITVSGTTINYGNAVMVNDFIFGYKNHYTFPTPAEMSSVDIITKASGTPTYLWTCLNQEDFSGTDCFLYDPNAIVYWDLDGQPNQIIETNSTGIQRITTPIPAYWKYPLMLVEHDPISPNDPTKDIWRHMLTQPCQTIVYENAKNASFSSAIVRSASATTWTNTPSTTTAGVNILGATTWVPWQSYAWKDPKGDGTGYNDFFISSTNWKPTGTIVKYNQNSQVLMTLPPVGQSTTINMRNDIGVPIGTIKGAHFDECGVLTGDYDMNETVNSKLYFDQANGWEKKSSVVDATMPHFGEKSISIPPNSFGPARNFRIDLGDDYIVSAWVNVASESILLKFAYKALSGYSVPFTDGAMIKSPPPSLTVPITQGWQLIKVKIPASTVLTASDWSGGKVPGIRIDFFNNSNDNNAYIDDIRFYPAKALVNTTYYDSKWQQPIVSVDQTNNPGKVAVYDDFGRATEVRKIDKNNPVKMELMSENIIRLAGEQQVFPDPNKWYTIESNDHTTYCIGVPHGVGDGSPIGLVPVDLPGGPFNDSKVWKFVPKGNGYFNIVNGVQPASVNVAINNPFGGVINRTQLTVSSITNNNQQWKLVDAGNGNYYIVNKISPRVCIDLDADNATAGVLQLYQLWNGSNQVWKIVEGVPPD